MTAPSVVVLARPGEEAAIFDFFVLAHQDNGFFPLSSRKTIDMISRGCHNKNASIGLIKGENGIEAATGVFLDTFWYSENYYIGEILNFVHEAHRKSQHARALFKFQKDFSDKMSANIGYKIPLITGIMTRKRLQAKMALAGRMMPQIGAIYGHNIEDHTPEDLFTQKFSISSRTAHGSINDAVKVNGRR